MERVRGFFNNFSEITSWVDHTTVVKYPYKILPSEFLEYAERDLSQKVPHAAANSLTNSKRALEAQIDYLLFTYGLSKLSQAERWTTAKKIDLMTDLSVMPARILQKLNSTRNQLEHRFELPSLPTAENALDIVSMFTSATDLFLYPARVGVYYEIPAKALDSDDVIDRITRIPKGSLHLLVESESCVITVEGTIHGVSYSFNVTPDVSLPEYLYLISFILHYHRFDMPNCVRYFKRLKFVRGFHK